MSDDSEYGLLDVRQAATKLGVSERTLRTMQRDGRIKSIRIGKLVRFDESDLNEWIAAQRKTQEVKARGSHPLHGERDALHDIDEALRVLKKAADLREFAGLSFHDPNTKTEMAALTRQVAELKAQVATLQAENAALRAEGEARVARPAPMTMKSDHPMLPPKTRTLGPKTADTRSAAEKHEVF